MGLWVCGAGLGEDATGMKWVAERRLAAEASRERGGLVWTMR